MYFKAIYVSAGLDPVVCCCEFGNEQSGSVQIGRICTPDQILFG